MDLIRIGSILVAAASAFALGGLWYSPQAFLNIWMKESGISEDHFRSGHGPWTFAFAFGMSLISAILFSVFVGPNPDLDECLRLAATIGVGWVAASFGINYSFAGRSFKLLLIDSGYHLAQFVLYALIFAWSGHLAG